MFSSGEPFFIADLAAARGLSPRLARETGVASALWQPVLRDGCVVGVLLVGWDTAGDAPLRSRGGRCRLFAAEAAVAIERADYLGQLEALNRALAMQLEALRVSDQLKTDFVSSVSHELRTPLTAILGYVEMLAEPGMTTGEQAEFLDIVDHNARRLEALITDLLTLSGVESGKHGAAHRADGHLRRWCARRSRTRSLTLNARRLKVVESMPDAAGDGRTSTPSGSARCWPTCCRTPPSSPRSRAVSRSTVDVRETRRWIGCQRDGARLRHRYPRRRSARLFERFFRARNATDQAIPGTGLGLAICSAIVEAHKGRHEVESELGRGTAAEVRRSRDSTNTRLKEADRQWIPRTVTVLVADDEPHLLRLVKFRLEREGYRVLTAADGDAALQSRARGAARSVRARRDDAEALRLRRAARARAPTSGSTAPR